jgi:hypothetical protein
VQSSLEYDCRVPEFEGKTVKLNDIQLELSTKNIVNKLEDLKLASHKIEEVDRLIAEQEWKIRQGKYGYHLSLLSYVGMAITSIVMFYYCCCRCERVWPGFTKWWKDNNPCTTIVIKFKIH